jgi:hypothetical protein
MLTLAALPTRDRSAPASGLGRGWRSPARAALVLGLFTMAAALPRDASAQAAPPPELLATVAIGPASMFRNFAAYADAVKPGSGVALNDAIVRQGLASVVGASSLDGLDPTGWSYLLVGSVDATPSVALAGKVRDAKKLADSASAAHVMSKGGWAVIGPKPLVERIGAHALATLPAQRAPGTLTATVYVPHVMTRFKDQVEAARSSMLTGLGQPAVAQLAEFMKAYVDGVLSLANDTEKLVITVEATAALASLDLALVPRAGSRLAKFVGLQRPSKYALLDRLPDMPAALLFGGHLELGPYRERMLELMATIYGRAVTKDLIAAMEALIKVMTGEVAVVARFSPVPGTPGPGMAFTQVLGVTDAGAADKAFAAMLALFKNGQTFDTLGVATTIKANPGTVQHAGVALRSYETSYDFAKVPEADRKAMEQLYPRGATAVHLGAFDRLGMIAFGPDSLSEARRAIDAARGKAARFAAPQSVGQLLASSRARKDSIAMMIDVGALIAGIAAAAGGPPKAPAGPQPIVMTLGCADHNAHIRIGLPATTARTAVNAGKP